MSDEWGGGGGGGGPPSIIAQGPRLSKSGAVRKSLPCTCILYLFHLKDCNGVLLVVDVATQRQTAE